MRAIKEYRWIGSAFLIFLAAIAVRALVLDEGYWIDEIISIETARPAFSKLIQRVGFADLHPPAYYILLSLWTSVFGESEVACRFLSLLLAGLTLVVLYVWAGRKGRWIAIMALLLLALSTFHIHYSVEVRAYPLLALLATLFLYSYQRITSGQNRWRDWTLLTATAALLVLTHYYAAILILAVNVHFFTVAKHPLNRTVRWCLTQGIALAGFGMWLPLLLVQYFHLPEGIFAHLQSPNALAMTALAFGPGPVHPSSIVAWLGTGLYGAAIIATLVADFPRRAHTGVTSTLQKQTIAMSRRQSTAAAVVLAMLLFGPMLSVAYVEATEATLPLLLQELPLGYLCLFCGVSLIVSGAVFNLRFLRGGHRMEPESFVFCLSALLICLSFAAGRPFLARNVIFLLPLSCLLVASALKARNAVTRFAIVALVLSLTVPSVVRHDTAFEARQDFKGTAALVVEVGSASYGELATFVLPMWDRPGLEFYLGEGTAFGIMSPAQIPPAAHLPDTVNVVLTRAAFERKREFLEDISRRLGADFKLQRTMALRRVFVAVYQRL